MPAGTAVATETRDRGVFTVTVPAGYKGDVVWTLRYAGQTHVRAGEVKVDLVPTQLAGGDGVDSASPSLPAERRGRPRSYWNPGGPTASQSWRARAIDDLAHRRCRARQGADQVRQGAARHERVVVQALRPGPVVFDPQKAPFPTLTGQSTTTATFQQPGEYVVRVKADTFGYSDASSGNQCCWTNGYQKVTVTR